MGDLLIANKLGSALMLAGEPLAFDINGRTICDAAAAGGDIQAGDCELLALLEQGNTSAGKGGGGNADGSNLTSGLIAAIASIAALIVAVSVAFMVLRGKMPTVQKSPLPQQNQRSIKSTKKRQGIRPQLQKLEWMDTTCSQSEDTPSSTDLMANSKDPVSTTENLRTYSVLDSENFEVIFFPSKQEKDLRTGGHHGGSLTNSRIRESGSALCPLHVRAVQPFWTAATAVEQVAAAEVSTMREVASQYILEQDTSTFQARPGLQPSQVVRFVHQAAISATSASAAVSAAAGIAVGKPKDPLLSALPPLTFVSSPSSIHSTVRPQFLGAMQQPACSYQPLPGSSAATAAAVAIYDRRGRQLTPTECRAGRDRQRSLTPLETLLSRTNKPMASSLPPVLGAIGQQRGDSSLSVWDAEAPMVSDGRRPHHDSGDSDARRLARHCSDQPKIKTGQPNRHLLNVASSQTPLASAAAAGRVSFSRGWPLSVSESDCVLSAPACIEVDLAGNSGVVADLVMMDNQQQMTGQQC
jgi:hypothetical protein